MSKRQAIAMAVVALIVQSILGFGFTGCVIGLAMGALFAYFMRDILNANYRLKPWVRRILRR